MGAFWEMVFEVVLGCMVLGVVLEVVLEVVLGVVLVLVLGAVLGVVLGALGVPGSTRWMLFWVRGACHCKNTANLEFDYLLTRFATF